ncbi:MAG: DNA polymerase III subunit chi [Enterobacterales bacterium]
MKHITFYLLKKNKINVLNNNNIELLVCNLSNFFWKEGKKILIACSSYTQAIKIDYLLWTYKKDSFLPHSLINSKYSNISPILIGWGNNLSCIIYKDLLINLLPNVLKFMLDFNEIIDFVPHQIFLKQLARKRYKQYLNLGFQISII